MTQFEAARCFYTALSFAAGDQHEQAYSLMDRATQRIEAAVRKWKVQLVIFASSLPRWSGSSCVICPPPVANYRKPCAGLR